eukprot:Em0014g297a
MEDGVFDDEDPRYRVTSKDPRSKAKYNVFSRILFLWLEPLLWIGCRRSLHPSDLYDNPAESDSSALLEAFKSHWSNSASEGSKSLSIVLLKILWWRIALQAALQFLEKCLLVGQSITLGYLTDYFREPCSQNSTHAYLYVMALSLMAFATVLVYTHGSLTAQKTGMMARVMCTAAIYDKVTQMAINVITTGQVINLASNDVQKLDYICITACGFVISRQHSSEKTDERVSTMKEAISAMKVIKMHTWESAFHKVIQSLRIQESQSILKSSLIRATNFALFTVSLTVITFLVFSVYTATGGALSPRKVFTILSLTATLRVSSIHFFVLAILNLSDTAVAITRIQAMLEVDSTEQHSSTTIALANPTLSDINFEVPESTLLQTLLGEIKPIEGTVAVNGVVSYASQNPWVFSGTLKENILFGSLFDVDRYNTVIQACTLNKDIAGFPEGDMTVIGNNGVSLSGGQRARVSLARAVYRKADIYLLDDPLSAVDTAVATHIFESCICGMLRQNTVLLVTNQLQFVLKTEQIIVLNNGKMVACCFPQELKDKEIDPSKLLDAREDDEFLYKNDSGDDEEECEDVERIGDDEKLKTDKDHPRMDEDDSDMEEDRDIFTEEKSRNRVSISTYFNYFRAGGSYVALVALMSIFILGEGSSIAADVWLAQWTGSNSSCSNSTYVAIAVRQILNRFAKDMSFLDELLPFMLCEYLILLLRCIAVVLTAASANYWIFIPATLLIVVLLGLRSYYLRTANQIKWLESNARSPLYNHLSATLDGLVTIRVFKQHLRAIEHFHSYQNEHSKAWYLQLVTTRWFGLRVDAISSLLITLVAIISVPLSMELDSSIVGLGLTYTLSLAGSLQYCIRLSGDTESIMLSAERAMQYSKLVPEVSSVQAVRLPCTIQLPPEWPQRGEIKLEDVSFRYSPSSPLVLKSISCHIKPAEKIGIVGRTGAGKSSLISMFFRLAQPLGTITIDGINANELDLHEMRCRLSIIPQASIPQGTVRYNLDPMEKYTDAELWSVLEKVQLKSTIELLDGGLEGLVSENGCNFSIGQRQLMCLARALLKKSKILVVDEATANVDVRTDGIIQTLIRDHFPECTVLTIAHRLNTIMDSDRILVLNRGRIKEFNIPYLLLSDRTSLFRKMVKHTGSIAAQKLQRMAYEAYLRKCPSSRRILTAASQRSDYGYERVALNEDISLVKKASVGVPLSAYIPVLKVCSQLRAARELSEVVDDIPVSSGSPPAETYDLLAVRPGSEKVFQHACSTLNIDIISLDLSQRIPFYMKYPQVSQAMERGLHFEICYSPAIRDVTARRNVIANAQELVKMTKGKNIILSSEARSDFELRPPEDVSNLCHLFGFKNDQCKGTLTTVCRSVLMHAVMRRETAKGVVGCVRMDSLLSCDKWQSVSVEPGQAPDHEQVEMAGKRGLPDAPEPKSKKMKCN